MTTEEMLKQRGSILWDTGCGCCSYEDVCEFCGAKVRLESDSKESWYEVTHEETCPWVVSGFSEQLERLDK